jgi:hypothetical protein
MGHTKSEVGYALRSPSRPWWGKKTLRTAAERLQWGDESAEAALATHRPTKGSEVDTPLPRGAQGAARGGLDQGASDGFA